LSAYTLDLSSVLVHAQSYNYVQSDTSDESNIIPTENLSILSIKYGLILDTTIESITHHRLYLFIDEWVGIPYKFGGQNKDGIDCSGFSGLLYEKIYNISLPRSSKEQSANLISVDEKELKEGDLLFFNTNGASISHVGIYLGNNKFVHASTIKGVTIDSLYLPYYRKYFTFAGRFPEEGHIRND
jgi:lipoprotein Spr